PPRQAPTNLPAPTSDLIGRDAEIGEVIALVAEHRLITLVGTAGIGKTRLAFEAVRPLVPQFSDGVWVVELVLLADAGLVPPTVATALGLDLARGAVSAERVTAVLRGNPISFRFRGLARFGTLVANFREHRRMPRTSKKRELNGILEGVSDFNALG